MDSKNAKWTKISDADTDTRKGLYMLKTKAFKLMSESHRIIAGYRGETLLMSADGEILGYVERWANKGYKGGSVYVASNGSLHRSLKSARSSVKG